MSKTVKHISAEQLLAQTRDTSRTVMWHGIALSVRTLLPVKEITPFVNSVMAACYDGAHDRFVPEMMDFAFRANVVTRYACVDLPTDIEEQYKVLYDTDIFDIVAGVVNSAQLMSIRDVVCALSYQTR